MSKESKMPRLLRTDDIRRYLQEKKDEIKERTRRWSVCSDASDTSVQSGSSIRSLPQYSSYRAFSSRGSLNNMSGLPTPSKSKSSKIVPRGQASKDSAVNGRSSGMSTPGAVSRENSFTKSNLPVMKRETSTPNMKLESPQPPMKRETSIPKIQRESSIPQIKRESSTPQIKRETSKSTSKVPSTPGVVKRESSASQIKRPASAGVRPRGASVNTDEALKIGDRVTLTGTTKNGVIQFIGETRFAKGEWAGIVLDTPVGKNDGTVAGVRYFQCEPNYGVFVKLEKLTKIADVKDNNYKPHGSVAVTPIDRLKAVNRTNTPVRTPDSTEIPKDLLVGDQVSIGDARTGTLRYIGETGFAKGIWCGVELKEPVGKNDGAVAGTRYFQCEPKYGLFAPAHKVKKIASGVPPPEAPAPDQNGSMPSPPQAEEKIIKNEVNITPVKVEAAPEKIVSVETQDAAVTSQIASLQLQLQDRETEIKGLFKDRENDRAEANMMLQQFQQSENKLTSLRITHDKVLRESDEEIKRLQAALTTTEKSKSFIEAQLEEERRKLEDLQFQLEEQIVTRELSSEVDKEAAKLLEEQIGSKDAEIKGIKDELETLKQSEEELRNKNSDIEFLLNESNEREQQSNHSLKLLQDKLKDLELTLNQAKSESDDQAVSLKEELERKQTDLESLKEEMRAKDAANSEMEFQIKKYREELNETIESKGALNKTIFDLNAKLEAKNIDISSIQAALGNMKSDNQDFRSKLKASELKVESLHSEKEALEAQVSQLTKSTGDTSSQVNYLNEELRELKQKHTNLKDENSQLEIKLENLRENSEIEKQNLRQQIEKIEEEKRADKDELKKANSILEENLSTLKQSNEELQRSLHDATKKLEAAQSDSSDVAQENAKKDEMLKAKNDELLAVTTKLKEAEALNTSHQNTINELQNSLEVKGKELNEVIALKENLDKERAVASSSQDELRSELDSLKQENSSLKVNLENLSKEKVDLEEQKEHIHKEYESKVINVDSLEKEKNEIEKVRLSLEENCSSLKSENNTLKEQLEQAKQETSTAKQEVKRMQADLSQGSDIAGKLQSELALTKEKLSSCSDVIAKLEDSKSQVENQCAQLKEENFNLLEENTKLSTLNESSEKTVQSLKLEKEALIEREMTMKKGLEEDRLQLQNTIESSLSQLQQKEGELSSWRVKAQSLEKKLTEQESKMDTLQSQLQNGEIKSSGNGADDQSTFKEELESKDSEIRFLNSLVVDLQNKYKAAEAKVKAIEEGTDIYDDVLGLEPDESPMKPGLKQRVFCDICDEFDLHDTEDCPTQSSADDVGTQYHAARGEDRPYCTICEVFGHKTEDCDDEETF